LIITRLLHTDHFQSVDLVASALLDLSLLSIWTAYVIYVPSVRNGVRDLFTGVVISRSTYDTQSTTCSIHSPPVERLPNDNDDTSLLTRKSQESTGYML
ncbi:hypothetical protein ANCCAN_05497, partial [Ancylostoma caninum]